MSKPREIAIFWDWETCPSPPFMHEPEVVDEVRKRVIAHFGGSRRAVIKHLNAYVDLRTNGKVSLRRQYATTPRSEQPRSGPTWAKVVLVDCPNNLKENSVDATLIRDMLAHATHEVSSDASATIVLITGDTLDDSNFISPISMLKFLGHHVVLVTANPEETRLKASVSPYRLFNWYTDIVLPRHLRVDSLPEDMAALLYDRATWLHMSPSLPNAGSQSDGGPDTLEYASDVDGHRDLGSRARELPPLPVKRFRFLIRCLQFYESTGCPYPTIKLVARSLATRRATHKDGFKSLKSCVRQARAFGIVETGGKGKDTWVRLTTR